MTNGFVRTQLFLGRHRVGMAVLAGLFALAALLMARGLRLNEDYTDMLPMSAPAIAQQVEALKHIRQADRLFVDVQVARAEPTLLAQAADGAAEALAAIPELGDIRARFEGTDALDLLEELQAQLPSLLNAAELQALEPRLTPSAIRHRLEWFKKALSQPQGLTLQTLLQQDPVGLGDAASLRLKALQAGLGDATLVAGRITSADGRHVLLSARPGFRPSETGRCRQLMGLLLPALRAVENRFEPGAVRIAVTGAHRVALDNATLIQGDSTRTSVIATVAVAALMLAAYRRRWLALLGLLPTLFGALGAMVVFYLTGAPVSAVALGCGSILIGVTVDYGIFIIYHADDSPPGSREGLARVVAGLALTLMFGALTTMAAFLVMLASPVSGHRQLGAFGAVGVLLAAAFALVLLPVFVPVGAPAARRALPLTGLMQRLFDWRDRHAAVLWPGLLLLTGLCAFGVCKLRFEGDLNRLNGMTPATRQDDQAVAQTWGQALALTTVVVTGNSREAAREQNELVHRLLTELKQRQLVDSFSSVAPLMPSRRTRQAQHQAWLEFWTDSRRADLSNTLAAASLDLGFRPAAFRPFLNRLAAPPAFEPATGSSPAIERLLGDYFSDTPGGSSICTLVKTRDRASFAALREAVTAQVPDARLLNKAALGEEIAQVARHGLPIFALLVVGLNAVLLYLFLGNAVLVAVTLLPMAAGIFWTLGLLGLCGLPIDMSNFIFVIFVLGVGGDYSLFLLSAELEPVRGYPGRTAATAGAVTICALTTLLGVGVLVLARHPALFSIGLTALLGISLSLAATLCLVPWCITRLRRQLARGALTSSAATGPGSRALQVRRLYRYQEPYVTQFVFWKLRLDPLYAAVAAVAPPAGRIVDLGCGFGLAAHWLTLANPGRTVVGLDLDEAKLCVARATAQYNPRVAFEQRDVVAGPYPPCDAVLLCDLLHYLPDQFKLQVLRQAFAALRPGGRLILRDAFHAANRQHRLTAWSERLGVWLGQNRTAFGLHFATLEQHQAWLKAIGFQKIQVQPNTGRGSNLLLVAEKSPSAPGPEPAESPRRPTASS